MHVCVVYIACMYCVYCKYALCILYVWSNQKIPAGLRPQWEAGRTTVCRQESRHSRSAEKDISPKKSVKRTFCNIIYGEMYFSIILSEDTLADNICAIHQRTSNTSITNLSASQNELMSNRKYIQHLVSYLLRISCTLEVLALYRAGLFAVGLCLCSIP